MEQRCFTGTDLHVSRACLGTMTFGGQADAAVSERILYTALDAGVNFVDTANVYTGGESERLLGVMLKGHRQKVVLASKVGMAVGNERPGLSREALVAAVENSLKRLQTDSLDLCYFHLPDWNVPLDESLAAMDSLVRDGKVRYPASSNFASWQVCRMLWIAEQRGYAPARIVQPMYNLLARRIEDEFLPACRGLGVSTVVYNPLAGGLLTGKHKGEGPLAGSRFDNNQVYLDRYWNNTILQTVERLSALASQAGRSLVSLSLNWLLCHTAADCVVLGASRVEHLQDNLRAIDEGALDPQTLAGCEEVWQTLKGASPKYNR